MKLILPLKLLFLIYPLISFVNSQTNTTNQPTEGVQELFLKNISFLVPNVFQDFIQSSYLSSILNKLDNNLTCHQDIRILIQSVAASERWALEMVDSTAKPQAGILNGNVMHIGAFDECLRINTIAEEHLIKGKYCVGMIEPHEKYGKALQELIAYENGMFIAGDEHIVTKLKRSYGFCLPHSCSAKDLQAISNLTEEFVKSPAHFNFLDQFCYSDEPEEFTTAAIVALSIFGFFGVIMAASTVYDIAIFQGNKKSGNRLFIAFSMLTNGRKIFAISKREEGNLSCLDGMRVLSMMWIVVCHRLLYDFFVPQANTMEGLDWTKHRSNAMFLAGTYSCDTFFLISGLLVTYIFAKHYESGVKISIPMFYVHRLLRIVPSFAMLILATATLLKYMGDGPYWPMVYIVAQKPCEEHWWITLLFIQNYFYTSDQCLGQGWYLAVDMQMYFIAPLILFPLVKWPKKTISFLIFLILIISGYVFFMSYTLKFNSFFFDQSEDIYKFLYAPTHVRGMVYLIGMIVGYYLHIERNKPLKISKITAAGLWIVSLAIMMFICLIHKDFLIDDYNVWKSSSFNAFSRIFWSGSISTIILLCIKGYGGLINEFLSNSFFQILTRLNYNMYLLHLGILRNYEARHRVPIYYTNKLLYHEFWGDYMHSLGLAFIWTLAFESPVIALEKVVFARAARRSKEEKNGVKHVENSETGMDSEYLHGSTISIIPNEINLETVSKKL